MRKVFAIVEMTETFDGNTIEKEFEISPGMFESIVFAEPMVNKTRNYASEYKYTDINRFKERKKASPYIKKIRNRCMAPKKRWAIMQRDNFRCVICGRGVQEVDCLQVDHIHPVSNADEYPNGAENINEDSNLQTLCWECNVGKFNRPMIKNSLPKVEEGYDKESNNGFNEISKLNFG